MGGHAPILPHSGADTYATRQAARRLRIGNRGSRVPGSPSGLAFRRGPGVGFGCWWRAWCLGRRFGRDPAQRRVDRGDHTRRALVQQRQHHPNRHHANHRQNKIVAARRSGGRRRSHTPAHIPGSGIHGRCTRHRPAGHAFLISATARRVVRSDPANPIATIVRHVGADLALGPLDEFLQLRGELVERTRPRRRRTRHQPPGRRADTYRATVFGEQPASSAASR